jgi:hypothetical protein
MMLKLVEKKHIVKLLRTNKAKMAKQKKAPLEMKRRDFFPIHLFIPL